MRPSEIIYEVTEAPEGEHSARTVALTSIRWLRRRF